MTAKLNITRNPPTNSLNHLILDHLKFVRKNNNRFIHRWFIYRWFIHRWFIHREFKTAVKTRYEVTDCIHFQFGLATRTVNFHDRRFKFCSS